jgi:hypothetical protein
MATAPNGRARLIPNTPSIAPSRLGQSARRSFGVSFGYDLSHSIIVSSIGGARSSRHRRVATVTRTRGRGRRDFGFTDRGRRPDTVTTRREKDAPRSSVRRLNRTPLQSVCGRVSGPLQPNAPRVHGRMKDGRTVMARASRKAVSRRQLSKQRALRTSVR